MIALVGDLLPGALDVGVDLNHRGGSLLHVGSEGESQLVQGLHLLRQAADQAMHMGGQGLEGAPDEAQFILPLNLGGLGEILGCQKFDPPCGGRTPGLRPVSSSPR